MICAECGEHFRHVLESEADYLCFSCRWFFDRDYPREDAKLVYHGKLFRGNILLCTIMEVSPRKGLRLELPQDFREHTSAWTNSIWTNELSYKCIHCGLQCINHWGLDMAEPQECALCLKVPVFSWAYKAKVNRELSRAT